MSDNLDHRHHDNRPDDMTRDQQCSILMSKALDCLGYNQDEFKYRVAYWKLTDDIQNNRLNTTHCITAGSQAEGKVRYYKSDIDTMIVYRDVICTDTPYLIIGDRKLTIFQTVNHDTAPGYTKLRFFKKGLSKWNNKLLYSPLLSQCGDNYFSSDLFTKDLMATANECNRKYTSKTLTKSGPAHI